VLIKTLTEGGAMSETRKIASIIVSDVIGYSRFAGAGRTPFRWWIGSQRASALEVVKHEVEAERGERAPPH
jgi:hypothetical protein